MGFFATLLTPPIHLTGAIRGNGIGISKQLVESAHQDLSAVYEQLHTSPNGLTAGEVETRLETYGPNAVASEKRTTWYVRLWDNLKNPLVILLTVLGIISYLTGDIRATIMILLMVVLGIVLRYIQEQRADHAAEQLKAMVSTTATVIREGQHKEISLHELVPGDIVHLSAGDMVPADVRLIGAKDLFLNQAALTGESMPVEKLPAKLDEGITNPLEMPNICFMGSNIEIRHRHSGRHTDWQPHIFWLAGKQYNRSAPAHQL